MRRVQFGIALFFVCTLVLFVVPHIAASSQQAYQDYLYQADVYRQKYNAFQISQNEYLKFKTLASEADVISKTRDMLSQRSLLLRAYLLLLSEKLNETPQLTGSESDLYHQYIKNEVAFLETLSQFVNSVQSVNDAENASGRLEDHYAILASSMRQITLGISLAKLRSLGDDYSQSMVAARLLIDQVRPELTIDRQTTADRWFGKISDKRTIFLQKLDAITKAISSLKSTSLGDLDAKTSDIKTQLADAQSELTEGLSYIKELINAMRYKD